MIDERSERAAFHDAVWVDPRDVIGRKPEISAFASTDLDLALPTAGSTP